MGTEQSAGNVVEINPLTGLYFNHTFFDEVEKYLGNAKADEYCLMAIDVEHFRLYNKIHGREKGDELLICIAELLKQFQKQYGGVSGYLGGDNFGILAVYNKEVLKKFRRTVKGTIKKMSNTVGYLPAFGIYKVTDTSVPAATMYDHATVALSYVFGNYASRSCEYFPDMDEKVEEEIRILSDIQGGLDRDEFTFFVQPQCDITKGKIVGGESLVRWLHHEKGMIPPGVFVPVLEKNGFIAVLDRVVWRKVCQWLRSCLDKGYKPVPISINVSRVDIYSMNVTEYLINLVDIYELTTDLIKVEITESAYTES